MNGKLISVFGGTGFLGRRVARHLLAHGYAVRVIARHPERGAGESGERSGIESVAADVNDEATLPAALEGAWGAINAVSLYVERKGMTFEAVHVAAAERLASSARDAGVERFVHVSGIGTDPGSSSRYVRSRADGEEAVRRSFPEATIVRPSVMFGPDDAFLTNLSSMLGRFPVFPLFGNGSTRLQPVHVEDVGEAIARTFSVPEPAPLYDLGGPDILSYRALVQMIARENRAAPLLLPAPFAFWRLLGLFAELLPDPPLTRNQVELLQLDNVASPDAAGFDALGITPKGIPETIRQFSK